MRNLLLFCSLLLCGAPFGVRAQQAKNSDTGSEQFKAREQLAYALGVLAYIYGFPLVKMEQVRQQSMQQSNVSPNEFRHRRRLQTQQDRVVVSPNNDTVYSSAWLDLAQEPLVLHTPVTKGRYCSYAFYDAWTNNFHVLSKRNTRDAAADYLLTGPNWKGTIPKGLTRIPAPTNSVWLLVRALIADEKDWPGVIALQEGIKLQTLSQWQSKTPSQTPPAKSSAPAAQARAPLAFFEQLGALLQRNPPPATDAALLDQFALIGLSVKDGFVPAQLDEATKAGLQRAIPAARQIITASRADQALKRVNGWLVVTKGGTFGDEYLFRAFVTEKGIGQLIPAEAAYLTTDVDGAGQPLNGAHEYVLRFAKGQLPPAHEFWSLTLYAADFFFIENPLNRFAIGDRTRGLQYDADGGLTIYLQNEAPAGHETNWLPAPKGDFNLSLRAYLPKPELLNNSYQPPAVQRVN
ncbi:MAG: DUF1254 domain-containing protein [Acidobacteria bacterium]|nr:DUF1254 domain-containing protein [Acidobacteriota bacterium]MBI3425436.1 DUF1254 domain-containing protein [Acidobacteriota bacterium]